MSERLCDVLPTHTPQLFLAAVHRAAELLRSGEVVALPTETVYGLAANALDAAAVSRIFEIKGRPAHNPMIVHVSDVEMAKACASNWPPLAQKLAQAFWPGPLTMVLPRASQIPPVVTAGGPTVGLRWPSHPFILHVIRECGFPLAAPSANLSNRISPTNAEHVLKSLGDKIPLIVDGGQSQVGIESTDLDLSVSPPRLLRPGMIHEQALLAVTGELALGFGDSEEVLKSPGQLRTHYAPKAKLIILLWKDDNDLKNQILAELPAHASLSTCRIIAHTKIPPGSGLGGVSIIPHDPEAFARAIYAELHQCDDLGADLIVVEGLPKTGEWSAISDRLKRAAAR
ncbi:MAG: L-threonylcarbamoyladenylate synthase [Verrucomicrobiota bacterium]